MNLSPTELQCYQSIHSKLIQNSQELTKDVCIRLFARGIPEQGLCEKVTLVQSPPQVYDYLRRYGTLVGLALVGRS